MSSSMPAEGLAKPSPPQLALGVAALAALVYLFFHVHGVDGDAAVYAATIRDHAFGRRSIHFGYYLVGWFAGALGRPFGAGLDESLVLMNAAIMATAVFVTARLGEDFGLDRRAAALGAAILAFSGNAIAMGTTAEIYALQVVCTVVGYRAWLRDRPVPAGLWLAASLLTSPLAAFSTLPIALDAMSRRRWKALLVCAVIAAVPLAALLARTWHDYFFGQRGLLNVGTAREFGPGPAIYNAMSLVKNFLVATPLLAWGAWRQLVSRSRLGAWTLAALVGHLPALLGMKEEGIFWFAGSPLLGLVAGEGAWSLLAYLRGTARVLAAAILLAACAAAGLFVWQSRVQDANKAMCRRIDALPGSVTVITSWDQAVALEFYAPGRIHDGSLRVVSGDVVPPDSIAADVDAAADLLVLERATASRGGSLLLPASVRRAHDERLSILRRVERARPRAVAETVAVLAPVRLLRVSFPAR